MIPRMIAVAFLGLAFLTLSLDLEAGGAKKPTKKDAPSGVIEIYKNKNAVYRFRVKNSDGKTIVMPLPQAAWNKKEDVLKAIEDLKTILNTAAVEEVKDEPKSEK